MELSRLRKVQLTWSGCLLIISALFVIDSQWSLAVAPPQTPKILSSARLFEQTRWYGIYIGPTRAGFLKKHAFRGMREGKQVILFETHKKLKIKARGKRNSREVRLVEEFEAVPPYSLKQAEYKLKFGTRRKRIKIRKVEQGYSAEVIRGWLSEFKELPGFVYQAGDRLNLEQWLRADPRSGSDLIVRGFSAKQLENDTPTGYIDDYNLGIAGEAGRADDKPLFRIVSEQETEASKISYSPDLFSLGKAKIDQPLGDQDRIGDLVLEVHGQAAKDLPSGPDQLVAWDDERQKIVLHRGRTGNTSGAHSGDEIEANLLETPDYPLSHPRIRALTTRAIRKADEQDLEDQVRALIKFIYRYIDSGERTSVSVFDLLRVRRGTCKDYARLFTTLARAAGIPAREVTGLVYLNDREQAFAGHTWNEVWLGGEWVPLDVTKKKFGINPAYLSFGSGKSGEKRFLDAMGGLSFKLVSISYLEPDQAAKRARLKSD